MKNCSKCGEEKPAVEFYKHIRMTDGLQSICKRCADVVNAAWQKANAERRKAITARYYAKNPDKANAATAAWRKANPDRVKGVSVAWVSANSEKRKNANRAWATAHPDKLAAAKRAWGIAHPAIRNASNARRKAQKIKATPAWAVKFFIDEAYDLAARRTAMKCGGIAEWEVDHVVPLRSKLVCGLHVHNNLAVIPAADNLAKGNRYWPGMTPCP